MEKLQYDSFYKFLVSLGVILIALPIVALVFVVNGEILLLSQVVFKKILNYFVYIILTELKHLCYTQCKAHK